MAKKRKQLDYVLGLISGRFETSRTYNEDGDRVILTTFVPMVENPNAPLTYMMKTDYKDLSKQQVFQKENLIYPPLVINREEFKKTDSEKKDLKIKKQQVKAFNNRTNKEYTTYNFELWQYAMKVNTKIA